VIVITDAIRDKIKEILDQNPGKYLRIVVDGTGCGGPYLGLSLDEPEPYEVTTRINGIDILISDDVKKYADKTNINVFLNQNGTAFP
jgi:Fe-S cluster assembly iron-binding protein IscA